MIRILMISLRLLATMILLTGFIYPLLVFGVGQLMFAGSSAGTLVVRDGSVRGSALIAQKFESDRYFHSRPSAGDYATVPSGASNLGPTSSSLKEAVAKRQKIYGINAPIDLLTASGSGLDPHLSPEGIGVQLERVCGARGFDDAKRLRLMQLVDQNTEGPDFGFLGTKRVNVLMLNLAMDELAL